MNNKLTYQELEKQLLELKKLHKESTLEEKEKRAFQNEEKQKFSETVLDNLPADIAVFDKNHKYLYINPKGINDVETRKWMIGKSDFDYCDLKNIDKSMAQGRRDIFNKIVESKQEIEWVDTYNKDGKNIYIMRRFYPVFIDDIFQYVIGYGIEVTELRKTQDELKKLNNNLEEKVKERTIELSIANTELAFQNQEKVKRALELKAANKELLKAKDNQYKMLFDSMTEMVETIELIYDNQGQPIDCYIREINQSFATFLGKTKDQLINKKASSIIGTLEQNWLTAFASVHKTGVQTNFESYIAEFDKYYFFRTWKISKNLLGVSLTDITHQNKEKGKRATELSIANIELENQSREKGKRADELKIANIELEYQSEEKEKRAAELIIANIELVFQNEEKAKRAAELVISKITFAQQSEENEKLSEELIIADLAVALQSELIVAKEKAEKNEIKLIELNATKDRLFSIIAHDLQSPFNSILGFSELLIKNLKKYEVTEVEKFLSNINLSAKNTLVLLSNLLNWAKSQIGQINFKPENVVLSSIIKEIFELSNSSAKNKNIVLNYIKTERTVVFADINMLKTVLRNLISNAIKFTNSNGEINVSALQNNNFIEISVSDNGVGMDEEKQSKLFRFETNVTTPGTENEEGSGLGLILCKEFVEKHNGEIWVESKLGQGSVFKIKLPFE